MAERNSVRRDVRNEPCLPYPSSSSFNRCGLLHGGRILIAAGTLLLVAFLGPLTVHQPACGQETEVIFGDLRISQPIEIACGNALVWWEHSTQVCLMEGKLEFCQGDHKVRAQTGVVWIANSHTEGGQSQVVHLYAEGNVEVESRRPGGQARLSGPVWQGRYETTAGVKLLPAFQQLQEARDHPLFQRAVKARNDWLQGRVNRTSFLQPVSGLRELQSPSPGTGTEDVTSLEPVPSGESSPSFQPELRFGPAAAWDKLRIRVYPRTDVPVHVQWKQDPQSGEWVGIVTSGVNVLVEGLTSVGAWRPQVIDISTDRMVIWTRGLEQPDLSGARPLAEDIPVEIYMEGNIVFREGERILYAERMYYDVRRRIGVLVNAELLTPVPNYEGLLRLRAQILRQLGPDRFRAEHAFVTSSRMGFPTYRLQAGLVELEAAEEPLLDPSTRSWVVDPETSQILTEPRYFLSARDNALYLGPVPVFIWPEITTDLSEPSFFLRRLRVKNDSVFGFQVLTDWDVYQLLGIRSRPEGTRWDISLDVMSDRGLGHGTTFLYRRDEFLGIPGPVTGLVDFWGIQDDGFDNLGRGRRAVPPEKDYRWRFLWQHRQLLPGDWQLTAETGWISDRNFLEQYFEREWDELKDLTTGIELKRLRENRSLAIAADYRINNFFTQTDWLPRLDHFWLGEALFAEHLTWYEHTTVGLARFRTASFPETPIPFFTYREWETSDGITPLGTLAAMRFASRHELDFPLQIGPFKLVPYVLGEVGYWGEDRLGEDAQRLLGQAGVRLTLPMWRVDPWFTSELWNLNGLAHKVVFEAEFFIAESSLDLQRLPLYDPLDDDALEVFRRRMSPAFSLPQLDERYYAVRTGLGSWVTSPSVEVAEDLCVFRVGMRHRWQTKRGGVESPRIIDWLTFDTRINFFPKPDRDNFGEVVGLLEYDLRWQIGNRLALLSEGIFDFFPEGQQIITVGASLERPGNGHLYTGIHLLQGAVNSTVLQLAYSYRLGPKWISSFSSSIDLGEGGNIGQNLWITRVGESLLVSLGASIDSSRDNWGIGISVEPRFLGRGRMAHLGGARVPPAGAFGLE